MFLVFVPFFVLLFLEALAVIGLLWSPIAAYTCARTARARGLNTRRYAITGAIYSILLFLPWVYLWSNLRNKPLSRKTITLGYILTYVLWLFGPIALVGTVIGTAFDYERDPAWTIILLVMLTMVVISVLHQVVAKSTVKSTHSHSSGKHATDLLPALANIMPFVYAYIGIILVILFIYGASPLTES